MDVTKARGLYSGSNRILTAVEWVFLRLVHLRYINGAKYLGVVYKIPSLLFCQLFPSIKFYKDELRRKELVLSCRHFLLEHLLSTNKCGQGLTWVYRGILNLKITCRSKLWFIVVWLILWISETTAKIRMYDIRPKNE